MGIREYGRLLRRGWLVISIFVALGLTVASVATIASDSEYRAQTTVFVSVSTADNQSSAEVGASFTSAEARVASYVALVDSSSVLQPVIDELGLDLSVGELAAEVTPAALPGTVIMSIDVVDADARRAAQIADAVAESLRGYVAEIERPVGGGASRVDVKVLEAASVPSSPLSPDLLVYLVLGGATGLILGVGLVVLRSLGDARIRSAKDIAAGTSLPVLESIPYEAAIRRTPLVVDGRSATAESFRMLRTTILFGSGTHERTLLVTSAREGDGKSVVAANLAASIAQIGRTVVVVDADLRDPVQSAVFRVPTGGPTLAELLRAGGLPADGTLPVSAQGVSVLPAGGSQANPSDLIGTPAMERIIGHLARRFDHVIVDSPAILTATDAVLLGKLVATTVLVAGVGVSTTADIVAAADRLRDVGGDVLGTVVAQAPRSAVVTAAAAAST
ncbi:polysaccharide biosynthesis tyrosine autokinase [Rathayibacter tanaceti]|uniref:Polysaccharide biosynthesis tyrosine autokinase n=2 Tax=Rathayibacter tanaceti TaxID=1671680 RepID=A0A166HI08_9MICO|nr:polysaccharide biosynthesis tyrosine autokinase [Rathayibacter tanaceti]KZX20626.1 Tyrosine-protein kinase ptk [Rathayibacter tanaceti]QHC54259.1 polysaccharide biosynthesis tyrosine autokinase [Rathayibacter tanaceti]TCO37937.1 capsular exopolysaccharide synthesis family protein [Rathayibacter tanaceti]